MNTPDGERPPVCAIVVTYHPDPVWPSRFAAVAAESATAVVVDNGSSAAEIGVIEREVARHGARLILNPSNLGLAAALNQGVRWAFAQGFRFALLFDQDTEPRPGIVAELLRVHGLAAERAPTAIVGANYLDDRVHKVQFPAVVREVAGWLPWTTVIVSGSLIERTAFERLGGFCEVLFVDYVDHEYCLRARASGFQVALATRPLMVHSIGRATTHRLPGRTIVTTNHPPVRRYYMARNRVILAKRYAFREPWWVLRSLLSLLWQTVVMLCVEDGRADKFCHLLLGVWHGLLGRTGPRPDREAT